MAEALKTLSDHEQLTAELLRWIGDDADEGTTQTLRAALVRAAEADVVSVRESMRTADPDNRAAWIIGALKSAREERVATGEDTSPRGDLLRVCAQLERHAQSMLTHARELRSAIETMKMPEHMRRLILCSQCGAKLKTERALAFHMQNVHDGPIVPLSELEEAAPGPLDEPVT